MSYTGNYLVANHTKSEIYALVALVQVISWAAQILAHKFWEGTLTISRYSLTN